MGKLTWLHGHRIKSNSELESKWSERSQRKEWKRKGNVSGVWQIRSSGTSVLVESSTQTQSDHHLAAIISESGLKACAQHFRAPPGSTNSDFTTWFAQRFSRSQTSCSTWTSILHHPGQVCGLSGHGLNINHFAQPFTSQTQTGEICSSLRWLPNSIGPSLPQHLQEPWATLIGAVTSIAHYPLHLMFIFLSIEVSWWVFKVERSRI